MLNETLKRSMKLCLVCSAGGHLTEIVNLKGVYNKYDHIFVTVRKKQSEQLASKTYFIEDIIRKILPFVINFAQSLTILLKEKPDVVITTGAGTALPLCYLAKFFRKKIIFIESFARVTSPSLFGKLLYPIADLTIVQWKYLLKYYKKAIYGGPIFDFSGVEDIQKDDYILVIVGTRREPFTRLVKTVDHLKRQGLISNRVIIQRGHTPYKPKYCDYFDFCSLEEIEDYIKKAKLVVTQESSGVVSTCLKYQTQFIIVPRVSTLGEIPPGITEDLHLHLEEMGFTHVVNNVNDLPEIIKLQSEKPKKIQLNNKKMMNILNALISTKIMKN